MQRKRNPHTLLVELQIDTATMENRRFLKKLRIDLPYDPATPLLGVYPKDLKTHI